MAQVGSLTGNTSQCQDETGVRGFSRPVREDLLFKYNAAGATCHRRSSFFYIYTNNPVKLQANELCIVATCISCRVWCLSRTRSSSRCPSSPECPPCEAGCRRSGDTRWALHQVMVVTAMHVCY